MDSVKRKELIDKIKRRGLPSPYRPMPLATIEEFFVGNDDYGSIGCNLTPMLGPQSFFERLKFIRSQLIVQDVLVEVAEVEKEPATWPFVERVYVFTDGTLDDVAHWAIPLQPDEIEEGFANGPVSEPLVPRRRFSEHRTKQISAAPRCGLYQSDSSRKRRRTPPNRLTDKSVPVFGWRLSPAKPHAKPMSDAIGVITQNHGTSS